MPPKRSTKLTRKQERDLDIEIGFIEGVIRRAPGFVEALQILGDDYTRRGRFAEGLKTVESMAGLQAEEGLVPYNLACSYPLTGEFAGAAAALHRALDLGYRDFKWLAKDPDLSSFRKHPLYKKIRARVKAMEIKIH